MTLRFTKGIPKELSSLIATREETVFLFVELKIDRKRFDPIGRQAMIWAISSEGIRKKALVVDDED